MVNKKIKKVGISLLLFVSLIVILSAKTLADTDITLECLDVMLSKVKYFDVSMWDFNPEDYNSLMRGISSSEYYAKSLEERANYDSKALLFGSTDGMNVGGIQNGYTGVNEYRTCNGVLQGLAEKKLNNGKLEISKELKNGESLFPDSGENCVEYLSNWKFPFLEENNGYYSFNSDEYHVSRDYSSNKFILHKGARNGFYPFNECGDNTFDDNNKNLFFTAKFEIPFLMTEDGKIKNTSTGELEDMVFNFSGDDDVWIFIDDDLVVDLGGVHIKQTGNINFATNTVNYSNIYNKDADVDNYNVTEKAIQSGMLSKGKHTLRVFYMERAGGESNLFVNFNLQSSGVKVNHIEKDTNKILKEELITGPVGYTIKTEAKNFENHKLSQKPDNEKIELKEDLQTVNYYYEKNHKLTVDYVDFTDGSKVAESDSYLFYENDDYEAKPKEIKDYMLVQDSGDTIGKFGKEDKNITFYYQFTNAKIKANYIDEKTGQILDSEERTGKEYTSTTFTEKSFANYVLTNKPKSNKQYFTKKPKEINYYYKKRGKIIVNYIDNATKKNLATEEKNGIEDEKVKTAAKEIKNYILYRMPEKEEYTINRKEQIVNYYYLHQSKVTVNYIDRTENKNLSQENSTVTEGTIFECKEKQFENYKLVNAPENKNVTIGKNDVVINYYYEKLKFNLKVTMNLKQATVNDHYYELNGKLGKIETEINEANSSSAVKIYYNVKVENTEERTGSGMLTVELPKGYIAKQEDNLNWEIKDGKVYINVENIKSKEERNYELVLVKNSNDDISGKIRNTIKIESNGIEEVTLDDNTDYNDLVIMPRTGIKRKICYIALIAIALVVLIFIIDKKINTKKQLNKQNTNGLN